MSAYYNDSDPFVCAWLRNLIAAGHLPAGDVDERPIQEIQPDDLKAYTQCHFFAGIGGWAYALQLAGWPAERPVWTGSCPCQPFSTAGKGQGERDPRHLWPDWYRLIRECLPPAVFGEQVAGAIGHGWWDLVQRDLEAEGYACGMVVLGAHSVGAPHIRQRLWFVADADRARQRQLCRSISMEAAQQGTERGSDAGFVADAVSAGRAEGRARSGSGSVASGGESGELAVAKPQHDRSGGAGTGRWTELTDSGHPWNTCDWLPCRDGKARPVEPGTFPLAHGIPARVGRLRAYGNAIVPQVAAAFIRAYLSVRTCTWRKRK